MRTPTPEEIMGISKQAQGPKHCRSHISGNTGVDFNQILFLEDIIIYKYSASPIMQSFMGDLEIISVNCESYILWKSQPNFCNV